MKKYLLFKKNSNSLPVEPTKEAHVPANDFSVEMKAMTQRLSIRVLGILVITDIILYIALRLRVTKFIIDLKRLSTDRS